MQRLALVLIGLLVALAIAAPARAGSLAVNYLPVDNFEGYADSSQLRAVWQTPAGGEPLPELGPGPGADGGKFMMLGGEIVLTQGQAAAALVDPPGSIVDFALYGVDLSNLSTLTVWVKAGPSAGPQDKLKAGLFVNGAGTPTHLADLTTLPTLSSWTRWDIDISGVPRTSVDKLRLNVDAISTYQLGQSVIGSVADVDAISFNNGATWLGAPGGGSGTAPWPTFAAWQSGVPAATTKARIPGTPPEGNWPALIGPVTVLDLTLEQGAELFVGEQGLTVTGTLDNAGRIQQKRTINSGGQQDFLFTGGYKGLSIADEVCATAGDERNSPCVQQRAAASALGLTTVDIYGRQNCPDAASGILRCFVITPTNPPPIGGVNVTFYFNDNELNGVSCASVNPYHFNSGLGVWEPAGSGVARSCAAPPYSVTALGVTDFSDFGLGAQSPSAVSLLSFRAQSGPLAWLRALLP